MPADITRSLVTLSTLSFLLACVGDAPTGTSSGAPSPDAGVAETSTESDAAPGTVVRVQPDGNDNNDGYIKAVKTLKRALAIASPGQTIELAANRYDAALGESFPGKVKPRVTIRGVKGGGAILVGSGAEIGLELTAARVLDVELEQFKTGIQVSGAVELVGVRIRSTGVGVAVLSGRFVGKDMQITGVAGVSCNTGIALADSATADITSYDSLLLGTSLRIGPGATATVTGGTLGGVPTCPNAVVVEDAGANATLSKVVIENGKTGVNALGRVALNDGEVRACSLNGIDGSPTTLAVVGTKVVGNMRGAIECTGADISLEAAEVVGNKSFGIYLQDSATAVSKLRMRNTVVKDNGGNGVYLFGKGFPVDLGTLGAPGGNTFIGNSGVGLNVDTQGSLNPIVQAVGNTWRASTQGSDAAGKYGMRLVAGGVATVALQNYATATGRNIQF
jgi:hypothetical protein